MYGKLWLLANGILGYTVEVLDFHHSLDLIFVDVVNFIIGDYKKSILSPLVLIDLLDTIGE